MNQSEYDILFDIYKTKSAAELNKIEDDEKSSPTERKAAKDVVAYKIVNGFSTNNPSKPKQTQYPQSTPNTKPIGDSGEPIKRSSIVIAISGVMLFISIVASIICFGACANEKIHDDNLKLVIGIIGGYVLLMGVILFAIMYGIGHILKKNEEMHETNKKIYGKMDEIINILMPNGK